MLEKYQETANFINNYVNNEKASVALVLGSGLSEIIKNVELLKEINFHEIPFFPVSTVQGHKGKLILGKINKKNIWIMAGRFHYYEGYLSSEVTFPIRVFKLLGVSTLILTNAAGGVNLGYKPGDLMLIKDHISFAIPNPLIGKNDIYFGPRFPDMSDCYNKDYRILIKKIAQQNNIRLNEGIYFGVTGPSFETKAEFKLMEIVGASAVGMSTVMENIIAVHCGMKVLGISVITNVIQYDEGDKFSHEEVLEVSQKASAQLYILFTQFLDSISNE